jgi:hypothetical protein
MPGESRKKAKIFLSLVHSKLATAILALLAILLGYLAFVQFRDQDLTSIFGSPPRQTGEPLYRFDLNQAATVNITNNAGETASFERKFGVWEMHAPFTDRADFKSLQTLVFAAASMRIEASLAEDEASPEKLGFNAGSYTIEIIGGDGHRLANYQVGRRSVWHHLDLENEQVHQSLFIKPLDRNSKEELADKHIYVCSGVNVRSILDQGFVALRDRHPFLFSKPHLSDIEIRRNGDLVHLSRESLTSLWKITKPLELRTNPHAVGRLMDQLYDLEATKVSNPEAVTETPSESTSEWLTLTIREFTPAGERSEGSATLTVAPPASPEALSTLATINNRTGRAVFEMPLTTAEGRTSLNQLPLAVNELRARTLLGRDFRSCEAFEIHASHLNFPLYFKRNIDPRTEKYRWLYAREDQLQPANELMVKKLRTVLEIEEVTGFSSDAAAPADLSKFGLHAPTKRVLLRFGKDDEIEILFGHITQEPPKTASGTIKADKFYAMQAGSNSVVEIDAGTYTGITSSIHEWRDSLLWSMSIVDLEGMTIRRAKKQALTLTYDDLVEEWTARREGEDITSLLNIGKARTFIDFLEGLRVDRWLGPDHSAASLALQTPVYTLDIRSRLVNDLGDEIGAETRTLTVARVSVSANNQYYYGHLSGDPDYFLLDRYAAEWFAASLLEKED